MSTPTMRTRMTEFISNLQTTIITELQKIDPTAPHFTRREWDRAQGGRGVSCTFTAPDHPNSVLEKAAVNISMIHGMLPPSAIKQMATEHASASQNLKDETGGLPFFAAGISLIIHPRNPSVPTVHANYRYFEITESDSEQEVKAWWFGGITDLTPNYLFEDDVVHFHKTLKTACDAYGPRLYPVFKKSCDDYFYIKHRGEHRGVGGIRFDDLSDKPHPLLDRNSDSHSHSAFPSTSPHRPRTPDQIFTYIKTCATAFLPSYLPILSRRLSTPSNERKRRWQLIRRGRYIEFNLLYDRGTKFGLATPGVQVENVLVSMPESARWEYMEEMGEEEGTEEGRMVEVLRSPREWV